MCTSLDAAAYILAKKGRLSTMKLQKLVYYSQAWSLVWDEKALFLDKIEAWASGPVIKRLYNAHRGKYAVSRIRGGNANRLKGVQRITIDAVLKFYGNQTPQWLSDLTHMEDPWKNARVGLSPGERGNREITRAAMAEYYSSLTPN